MTMWIISRPLVNKIFAHAQRVLPRECVGVLSGQGREATDWHPLTNIAEEARQFLADPEEQIRLFRSLREQGREVVAIYHSHPHGPAEPSSLDRELATYPDALLLIVGMQTDGRLEINGFLDRDGRMEPQELTIRD
ncbi:MAG: M67 family metallopeptidase [Magnetococcales bacterium]|nr:M67 family metallopeptidase [Magnetococcales bacterium]